MPLFGSFFSKKHTLIKPDTLKKVSNVLTPPRVSTLKQRRYKDRVRYRRRFFLFGGIVSIFFFIGIGLYTIHHEYFEIKHVVVLGNQLVKSNEIENHVSLILDESFIDVIPNNSRITVPKKKIISYLLDTYPQLYSVTLSSKNDELSVLVKEREEFLLWCTVKDSIILGPPCVFTDTNTFGFKHAPYIEKTDFIIVGDESHTPDIYKMYVNGEHKDIFMALIEGLQKIDFRIQYIILRKDGTLEFTVYHKVNPLFDRSIIIVHTEDDVQSVIAKLSLLIKNGVLERELDASDSTHLDYLDLRFDNRIFYKAVSDHGDKNSEVSEVVPESTELLYE